jgi:uncharacterized membrane protein (DUF2068 family)
VLGSHTRGLRLIAIVEALKGVAVLIAGFGLLTFLGQDTEAAAEQLVNRLHLNPARHYPQVFIHAMAEVTNTRLWLMAAFAGFYAAVRLTEAYGLWKGRSWAEWFAALSSGIYVPIELYELIRRATWLKFGALTVNLIIVAYLIWILRESRRQKLKAAQADISPPLA